MKLYPIMEEPTNAELRAERWKARAQVLEAALRQIAGIRVHTNLGCIGGFADAQEIARNALNQPVE